MIFSWNFGLKSCFCDIVAIAPLPVMCTRFGSTLIVARKRPRGASFFENGVNFQGNWHFAGQSGENTAFSGVIEKSVSLQIIATMKIIHYANSSNGTLGA
jgi:hypothetical protein